LGGTDWGDYDIKGVRAAVRFAFDAGIRAFDTADVYGLGRSEEELAYALGGDRHNAFIISKFGVAWRDNGDRSRARTFRDASPAHLKTSLEASLRRLRIDAIPLYLVHWPDETTPLSETMEALERHRQQGKILQYGLSNFSSVVVDKAAQKFGFVAVENQFSLLDIEPATMVFEVARRLGITTMAYGPLAQGMLSGKYGKNSRFAPGDRRCRLPQFSAKCWERNDRVLETLRRIAVLHGRSPSQVAIRWVLDSGLVDAVVIGAKKPAQVESNLGAFGWSLKPSEWQELKVASGAS
jgi:aryl-alcohol dehydrogenase-like predicted oxidoreductase